MNEVAVLVRRFEERADGIRSEVREVLQGSDSREGQEETVLPSLTVRPGEVYRARDSRLRQTRWRPNLVRVTPLALSTRVRLSLWLIPGFTARRGLLSRLDHQSLFLGQPGRVPRCRKVMGPVSHLQDADERERQEQDRELSHGGHPFPPVRGSMAPRQRTWYRRIVPVGLTPGRPV